jgi:amidohydrolase
MKLPELRQISTNAMDSARPTILGVAAAIHARPELGKEEHFASSLASDTLEAAGFTVVRGYAGSPTAFRAEKGTGPGPVIAFMAEYDALPGVGHACGHNLICASALAAGIGLGSVVEEAGGRVVVFGTPAEETDGAKVAMAAAGCFDDVDVAMMVHPYNGNFWITESLAMDAIEVEYFGKSTHAAASPWEGVNALDAVLILFNSLNALRQQLRPDARVHGIITDGGMAPNVIPEHTAARFYVRAGRRGYLDTLVQKFRACADAAAGATACRVSIHNYESSFDDMASNRVLSERFRDHMVIAPGSAPFLRCPDGFGSLDMGNVSHVVPSVHALFDITGGVPMSLHTPEFRDVAATPYAAEAMLQAARALVLTGLDAMTDAGFLAAARDGFRSSLGHEPKGRF